MGFAARDVPHGNAVPQRGGTGSRGDAADRFAVRVFNGVACARDAALRDDESAEQFRYPDSFSAWSRSLSMNGFVNFVIQPSPAAMGEVESSMSLPYKQNPARAAGCRVHPIHRAVRWRPSVPAIQAQRRRF